MVVRPPTAAKVFGMSLFGLIGVGLVGAALAALMQGEAMLVTLTLVLVAISCLEQ